MNDHVPGYSGLAGEPQARIVRPTRAPLADQVLPLKAPHRDYSSETGDDHHGAVGALTVAVTPDRPVVAGPFEGLHHGLDPFGADLCPQGFDTNSRHVRELQVKPPRRFRPGST